MGARGRRRRTLRRDFPAVAGGNTSCVGRSLDWGTGGDVQKECPGRVVFEADPVEARRILWDGLCCRAMYPGALYCLVALGIQADRMRTRKKKNRVRHLSNAVSGAQDKDQSVQTVANG